MRPLIVIFGLLVLWALAVRALDIKPFFLPSPEVVLAELLDRPGFYLKHAWYTGQVIVLGLIWGVCTGFVIALILIRFSWLEVWVWPLLVASQAIPVFAIGPLLVLWLGYGLAAKVVMASLIVFFSVTVSTKQALSQLDPSLSTLAKSFNASPFRAFYHLYLPAAFQLIAPGLLIAVAVAPIGAVVGEWIGSSKGLGHVMLDANAKVQSDTMVAALLVLCVGAYGLYAIAQWSVHKLGWWFATGFKT